MIKNKKGFTMIEVLVAITLLSITFLALAGMQIMSIRGNAFANRLTTAVTTSQDKIEELRRTPYNQIVSDEDTVEIFTRTWNVQDNTPVAGTKTVTLTVSWQDRGQRQVQLQTIIGE